MSDLAGKTCTPCKGGIPPLSSGEAEKYLLSHAPDWQLEDEDRKISRTFKLDNYKKTVEFVKKIAVLAESEGHHPLVTFGWGFCRVELQTKKIKGLHENDFIMAVKIDQLPR